MKNLQKDIFLSVAFIADGNGRRYLKTAEVIYKLLKKKFSYFEILVINNNKVNTTDMDDLLSKIPNLRVITLSKQYSREMLYNVALENSLGDYLEIIDTDNYDPEIIPFLFKEILGQDEIVIVYSKRKIKFISIKKITYLILDYVFLKALNIRFRSRNNFCGILTRNAVNSIVRIRNKKRFLIYSDVLTGIKTRFTTAREYLLTKEGKTSLLTEILYGIDVLISTSNFPLRVASLFGLAASLLSFLFLVYVVLVSLIKRKVVEGWITTSIVDGSLFLVMFVILTILSEYVSRILSESKEEPLYFISKDEVSSVRLNKKRKKVNVV